MVVSTGTSGLNCHWTLETAKGVVLRDTATQRSVPAATIKTVEPGDCVTLADLGMRWDYYGTLTGVSWTSSGSSVASINSSGVVSVTGCGETVITLNATLNGAQYSQSYSLACIKTVNLEVLYDQAYLTRYPDAVIRITGQLAILQDYYLTNFYTQINFTDPTLFASYADMNCNPSPNARCNACKNASCFYSQAYFDEIANEICVQLAEYHHKNITNIAMRIPFPDTSHTFRLAYIGHVVCDYAANIGCTNEVYGEQRTFGITYSTLGLAVVADHRSDISELVTVIHEFGHLFYAPDHYGGTYSQSTSEINQDENYNGNFETNCLYGEGNDEMMSMNDLAICPGCRDVIFDSINATDQT